MKTLYLVRHAKSSWAIRGLADFDRPLNERGERDVPEVGRRLKTKGVMPDLLLSSPANRALMTGKGIAAEIGYPPVDIQIVDDIYHAGESQLLRIIQSVPDNYSSLMLFGHNPGLTWLANALADIAIDNLPTCGVVGCTFSVDKWKSIALGKGAMLFYDYPKNKEA